jgi:hypothetical protein
MLRLNQVVALVKGKNARATQTLTACHRVQDPDVTGIIRTYTPKDEDGEVFPPESKEVGVNIEKQIFPLLMTRLTEYYDTVTTQENGNSFAKGTVTIDGKPVLVDMPITVLLFLEKQVVALLTFIKQIPILPADKEWRYDGNKGCWVSYVEKKTKTAKVPKVVIKYAATKEHPAQTEMFSEDKTIGTWQTQHLSGAIPVTQRDKIIERLYKMHDAIKSAREDANNTELPGMMEIGEPFFEYIFAN